MTRMTSAAITTPPGTGPMAFVTRVARAAVASWAKFRARQQTMALLELDERLLHDIGLSRGDVHDALAEPGSASAMLSARAARHRQAELDRLRAGLRSALPVKAASADPARLDRAA